MSITPSFCNDTGGYGDNPHPYLLRQMWTKAFMDPRRDLDTECGYPHSILPIQYRYMYDREGIGSRVVDIYPDECWAVDPEVYEQENPQKSGFEQDWEDLLTEGENNPLHYLHRIDILSGIGRYGALLIGTDDGLDLSEPLPGSNRNGTFKPTSSGHDILYMRAFDESMALILDFERDTNNPRYGRPTYYMLLFADVIPGVTPLEPASVSMVQKVVHWSRVIHIADKRETSETYGVPRMRNVFNRLCDVRKILGGSGEMFWKGGFPGYSFELNPELALAGVQFDKEKLDEQLRRYSDGMQRYLAIVGLQAKSLAPQVANPEPTMTVHLNAIAISIGCPLRIFTGSEQAQLASGQDVRTWNRRLSRRQRRYLSPFVIRPFVDRMIAIGKIRPPAGKSGKSYNIHWPDVNMPSAEDQSKIFDRNMAALAKYMANNIFQVIEPREMFTMLAGMPIEQVEAIASAMGDWKRTPLVAPTVQAVEVQGEVDAELQDQQQSHDKSMAKLQPKAAPGAPKKPSPQGN